MILLRSSFAVIFYNDIGNINCNTLHNTSDNSNHKNDNNVYNNDNTFHHLIHVKDGHIVIDGLERGREVSTSLTVARHDLIQDFTRIQSATLPSIPSSSSSSSIGHAPVHTLVSTISSAYQNRKKRKIEVNADSHGGAKGSARLNTKPRKGPTGREIFVFDDAAVRFLFLVSK